MTKWIKHLLVLALFPIFFLCDLGLGAVSEEQRKIETGSSTVVRNKTYFKKGRVEFGPVVGVMPYDSLINHYMVGGRGTWHIGDHFGWEFIDALAIFPSTTSYAKDLVTTKEISNLQTTRMKYSLSTNLVFSPIYGKFRLFGRAVVHFDIYGVIGGGFASVETLKISTPGGGTASSEGVILKETDPMITLGVGFKFFLNRGMSLLLETRDYIVIATKYGNKRVVSNFSVFVGLTFHLPTYG